jgi:hypothetical protein
MYPDELEMKDTAESDISASYLDILLNIDSNGRLTTTLLTLELSTFLFYTVIYHFHLLVVCISQLIQYARASFAYENFSKWYN